VERTQSRTQGQVSVGCRRGRLTVLCNAHS
jgi:hypothetical protein